VAMTRTADTSIAAGVVVEKPAPVEKPPSPK
jgi:hypothetical protein